MAGNYGQSLAQTERAAERAERARQRELAALAKEAERRYVGSRASEVDRLNRELEGEVGALEGLLAHSLSAATHLDFAFFKAPATLPVLDLGPLAQEEAPPLQAQFVPEAPRGLRRLSPGAHAKHMRDCEAGRATFERAMRGHGEREAARRAALEAAKRRHSAEVQEIGRRIAQQHAEVDSLAADFEAGKPLAIAEYFSRFLDSSPYPEGLPRQARVAYVPESKQLVVEYDLPTFAVVPEVATYRYVKAGDKIVESPRSVTARRALYASVIAQVALRTVHELFQADAGGLLETVVFNGHVDTVDAGTGRPIRPCLVTVRTTREAFSRLDLSKVEPVACLKTLNASISKSPAELVAVRPVLEFNMVDPRFVQEADVLSGLDQRPNLMCLTPGEFESLITNLFQKMGLETRQTQASRDGGVDCVAYDPRPIFGGKVVIQAKRYKHTVGVSAVRDLFGTVQNEGASKGLLVTTSGYGKASFQFAEGKPLELLSGSNLLYLLAEHAGIEAKIEPRTTGRIPSPTRRGTRVRRMQLPVNPARRSGSDCWSMCGYHLLLHASKTGRLAQFQALGKR